MECCVDVGDISAAEALKLLSVLRNTQSVTFKLTEVNNDTFPGLKMSLMRKCDNGTISDSPLFKIAINESLNPDREEVIDILQKFAREIAILATQDELASSETVGTLDDLQEEWFHHPNIMPARSTRH